MRTRSLLDSLLAPVFLLKSASLLAPGPLRGEWFAEWQAELWHVSRQCSQRETLAFCFGAFPDAFWLRLSQSRRRSRRLALGSALRCVLSLGLWTAVSLLLCLSLPGSRKVAPSFSAATDSLIVLSSSGFAGSQTPSVRLSDYLFWKAGALRLFDELAFYQTTLKRAHIAPHRSVELSIVRGSKNLFKMLNLPSFDRDPTASLDQGELVLNERTWHKDFQSDPQIVGRSVEIGGRRLRVAGVLSPDVWRLPGQADAWLLEDDRSLNSTASHSPGFVLGQLRASAFPAPLGDWHYITVPRLDGESERFDCIPLSAQIRQPFSFFLFTLLVACLALPATTPLPLGEYPAGAEHLGWRTRIRRWLFLSIKLTLIVPAVYFTSLVLAYGVHPFDLVGAQYIQLSTSFFGLLFALRWALQDQRKRCPVCLRRLTNPAQVGEASRDFLAWNGTELICAGGHGLLHIPEIPTSWFSTQRWLYLDPSWSSLFCDVSLSP